MKRYFFDYQTLIDFSAPVINHSILLRPLVRVGDFCEIEEEHFVMSPDFWMRRTHDAFGNRIIFGGLEEPHSTLVYSSMGIVNLSEYKVAGNSDNIMLYLQPTKQTAIPKEVFQFNHFTALECAIKICNEINSLLKYTPGATSAFTSANEALKIGCGVCQDFAHVMIGILRNLKIPSRYVCGFIEGEGETHAWVEVFDGNYWHGFDPTHNKKISYGYVKIAHGRDSSDCPVNRGMYSGIANEKINIKVTLKEL